MAWAQIFCRHKFLLLQTICLTLLLARANCLPLGRPMNTVDALIRAQLFIRQRHATLGQARLSCLSVLCALYSEADNRQQTAERGILWC